MNTRRLPTGTLGAESLAPLGRQIVHRYEWLRRNEPAERDELVERIARELAVEPERVERAIAGRPLT